MSKHPDLQPHAHTISLIRHLRALDPPQVRARKARRRGGRIPPQRQPERLRREYFAALMPTINLAIQCFGVVQPEILRMLEEERRARGKTDRARLDASRSAAAQKLIEEAAGNFARAFRPSAVYDLAEQFGRKTSEFQKGELDRQVRAALGVGINQIEKPVRDMIPTFSKANTELVKTVPDRYWDRLAKDTRQAYADGTHPRVLAEQFVERDGMAARDAERLARDQIGKLNADVNQMRQEAMGVVGFVWRTMNDNRVRDEHAELDGQSFLWDELPENPDTGEEISPGSEVQCRCYSEPDFSPLLEGLDE